MKSSMNEVVLNDEKLFVLVEMATESGETGKMVKKIIQLNGEDDRIYLVQNLQKLLKNRQQHHQWHQTAMLLGNDLVIRILKKVLHDHGCGL